MRATVQLRTTCAALPAQHRVSPAPHPFFACRNRSAQLHFVPPASGQRFFSLRLHRATRLEDRFEFPTTCAASSAQHALRAQARRSTPIDASCNFSSLPIACPEARRAQPHSSLSILYHLRSTTRATSLLCVPQPQRAIALPTAGLRPAPILLTTALLTSPSRPVLNPPLAQPHPRNKLCAH
jgi:hypothetical protein